MKTFTTAALLLIVAGCNRVQEPPRQPPTAPVRSGKSPSAYPPEFWAVWQDGKSEVSAYDVTYRDGHRGVAIVIFALERFSIAQRVSVNDSCRGTDVFPAMKMNVIRDYTPGTGDMLSVVAALEPLNDQAAGGTTKVVFTSWDWSGPVWRQMLLTGNRASISWHSYAAGQADGQSTRSYRGIPEDALPMCARRIAWPVLRLGQSQTLRMLPSLSGTGIHTDRTSADFKLALSSDRHTRTVPAGSFRTHTFTADAPGGLRRIWHVEADPPHRIVRWQTSTGETGALLGSGRWKYSEAAGAMVVKEVLRHLGLERR